MTAAAREELQSSGRYTLTNVDAAGGEQPAGRKLRFCDGCEAGIAGKLGARQSLLGIVRRVTQTDYYILVVIRDAASGKIVDAQVANFAGGEDGWASGVRRLIRRQVLAK